MALNLQSRSRVQPIVSGNTFSHPELNASWQVSTQHRRQLLLLVLAVLGSLVSVVLVLTFHVLSVVALLTWIALLAIAWRPFVGLCVAYTLVLLFESGGADKMMEPGWYFQGGLGATIGLTGAIASPLELLLVLVFGIWLAQGVARRKFAFRGGSLGWPMTWFLVALVFGVLRGIAGGGDINMALWESRFLFYTVMCYLVAANTVRTKAQVTLLISITMLAIGAYAIEGAYRRVELIDTGKLAVIPEFAYSHESVIFLGTLMLLTIAQWVFGAPAWQKTLGLVLLPITAFTLLATERRAGYIALIIGFLAYALVFLIAHRKAFFSIAVPLMIALAIYLPLFWNNTTLIGQPARAIRSLSQPDPRDASSNLYRDLELINVKATIHANPLLGVGFGRPFDFVVSMPDLSWWPFWHFEPHHNILWVWLKMGPAGFIAFWTLMGVAIARSAYVVRKSRSPQARIFGMLSLAGIIVTLIFCYVDLGLVSGRVTVFLGTLMGTVSVLDQLPE
jgi:hypothetical protein